MPATTRFFVSALLLVSPILVCSCGGGGDKPAAASGAAPAPVASANRPPSITGSPLNAVVANEPYEFRPLVNDADGDTLLFTATNLPPWATLNPATGAINGIPVESDLGAYEDIVVTVSDGHLTASLAPFLISVNPEPQGSVTIAWDRPMAKVDGTPLDDLGGYRILYGRSQDDLDQSVLITNPDVNSYVFQSIPQGVWYFTVVGVSQGGLEGPRAPATMKIV
jgi:hypothetical protein